MSMIDGDDEIRSSETVDLPPEPPLAATPRVRPHGLDYATVPSRNRAAAAALVWGFLLFVPFVAGVLAIRYGRRGMRDARDAGGKGRRRARAGIVLGCVNLVAWLIIATWVPFARIRARREAEVYACTAQLRAIGQTVYAYYADRAALPPTFDALVVGGYATATTFVCPTCARDPSKPIGRAPFGPCSYVYVRPGPTLRRLKPDMVLAYEPLTDHPGRGAAFLIADGSVRFLPPAQAQQAIAGLAPGQNPPPTLQSAGVNRGPPSVVPATQSSSAAVRASTSTSRRSDRP
jgi:hypothetical protein